MPAQNKSKIQFYRTNKNIDNSSVSSKTLYYGEPLFVDGPNGTYLVIGSKGGDDEGLSSKTVANEKWLAFADKSVASKSVYYNNGFFDSNGNPINVSSEGALNFKSPDDTIVKAYNGGEIVNITSSDITQVLGDSAVFNANTTLSASPSTSEPADSKKIATVEYVNEMLLQPQFRGYKANTDAISTSNPVLTCDEWNYEYRVGTIGIAAGRDFTVTLPPASTSNEYSSEIRICFIATTNFKFVVTKPSGWIINGDIETLEIKAGTYYEISFAYLGTVTGGTYAGTYINCLVNEVPLG